MTSTLPVFKDLLNRKHGCSLTPSNTNFGADTKKSASKALIQKGSSGTFVAIAEGILTAKGYYTGKIDAEFGSGMDTATRAFQKVKGLTVDGQIGANTWYALFN